MDIVMQSTKIKETASIELRKKLENPSINFLLKDNIKVELEIRQIVNTSALEGVAQVARLKDRAFTGSVAKMRILSEAEHRESCGLQRQSLLKKIRATLKRIETKSGMRMLHMAYHELSPAPWYPIEDYNPKKHAPNQQHQIKGVPIDPCLPYSFDNIPNEERDPREVADWWGRAFVVSGRSSATGLILYQIRRLDGGAWDRSTWIGNTSSLDFAVNTALNNTQVLMSAA